MTASQISHGRENDIWIEVDGTKASLEWHQEEPNKMLVRINGEPHQIYTRAGGPYLGETAAASTRIPSGHPEGVSGSVRQHLHRRLRRHDQAGQRAEVRRRQHLYPNVADGVDGMNFITQCVASSNETERGCR